MRVGIIAEGRGDLAVLTNILKGRMRLDGADVQHLRPEFSQDETDLYEHREAQHSNWSLVRDECLSRTKICDFLESGVDDERLVVIQIDTAEAGLPGYDVVRPLRQDTTTYVPELRDRVVAKITEWLQGEFVDRVRFAIAVEETDAWVLTILAEKESDTGVLANPKERLQKAINDSYRERERQQLFQLKTHERYKKLTLPFRKHRDLDTCAARNASLRLFIESLPAITDE